MDFNGWLFSALFLLGVSILIGFFATKKPGFGRYATSSLVIISVLIFSVLLFAAGKIDEKVISNILFSALGFAGGLFATRESNGGAGTEHEK